MIWDDKSAKSKDLTIKEKQAKDSKIRNAMIASMTTHKRE
jgi:hypothetical protein